MKITKDSSRVNYVIRKFRVFIVLSVSGLLFGLTTTALAGENSATGTSVPYQVTNGLAGKITVAGSDTMRPIIMRLAGEFSRHHPDVRFTVEGGGSSAAVREFVMGLSQQRRADKARSGHGGSGRVSLIASSRPLTAGEVRAFKSQHGYEPAGIPIAIDAVVLYVNPENPIEGLTLEQVAAMFGEKGPNGGSKIRTWGELGLKGDWENRNIRLYGRDKKSGTREFFEQHVLHGHPVDADALEQLGPAMEILAIARDHNAIGYAGAGIQSNLVRMVPLAGKAGEPFVMPTTDMVAHGNYPLTRYLFLYVDKDPKEGFEPNIKEFINFVNSASGQSIVAKVGSYRLPEKQLARNAAFIAGTSETAMGSAKDDPRLSAMNGTGDVEKLDAETPKED